MSGQNDSKHNPNLSAQQILRSTYLSLPDAVQACCCSDKLHPSAGQRRHIPLGPGHVRACFPGFGAFIKLLLADLRQPVCLCSGAYVNLVTSGIPQADLTKVSPLLFCTCTCLAWYSWAALHWSSSLTSPHCSQPQTATFSSAKLAMPLLVTFDTGVPCCCDSSAFDIMCPCRCLCPTFTPTTSPIWPASTLAPCLGAGACCCLKSPLPSGEDISFPGCMSWPQKPLQISRPGTGSVGLHSMTRQHSLDLQQSYAMLPAVVWHWHPVWLTGTKPPTRQTLLAFNYVLRWLQGTLA